MQLGIKEIKKRLHHRYPFLLIDRVIELEEGVSCTAVKGVTGNEDFFQGHFPENPVMPGVLIIEAMAQAGGIAGFSLNKDPENNLLMFVGIDGVKFRGPVVPGDQLILKTTLKFKKLNMWGFNGEAYVNDKLVASGTIKVASVPIEKAGL